MERISELEDLMAEITEEAISVKLDYETTGSNLDSGSVIEIHQDSPLLINEKEKLGDIAFNIEKKTDVWFNRFTYPREPTKEEESLSV